MIISWCVTWSLLADAPCAQPGSDKFGRAPQYSEAIACYKTEKHFESFKTEKEAKDFVDSKNASNGEIYRLSGKIQDIKISSQPVCGPA